MAGSTGVHAQLAPEIQVRSEGDSLLLAWPGTATGYRLETTTSLVPETGWQAASETVSLVNGEFVVAPVAADTVRFFRLFRSDDAGNNPPSLTGAALDSSVVAPDGTVNLRFRFNDPDGDFQSVVITRSNWLGETTDRIPAAQLGVTGTAGEFNQPLGTRALTFGVNSVCVSLEDAGGRQSVPVCLEVTLSAGIGGTAPLLTALTPGGVEQRLPEGLDKVLRQFALAWTDPDGDVERVRGRIIRPGAEPKSFELPVRSLGFSGNGGTTSLPLLGLTAADEPGENHIEVALVDANGNVGNTLSAVVVTARDAGEEMLRVEDAVVEHSGDPLNRVMVVNGRGFDTAAPDQNRVQLNGQELAVLAVTATTLRAALPPDAQPGVVRVANQHGSAWAPDQLAGLPLELRISPEGPSLSAGLAQVFTAQLNSRPNQRIAWAVDGIPGGNAAVGFISPEGMYVAPAAGPAGRTVTVSAAWLSDPQVVAEAVVRLVPPPPAVDSGMLTAKAGGMVVSKDGRASVELPPEALGADAMVSVRLLEGPERPAAPAGKRVLTAFDFTAQPAAPAPGAGGRPARQDLPAVALRAPAVITIPLAIGLPPGPAPIPGLEVRVGGVPFDSVPTMVSEDGSSMSIQLPVFGEIIIFIPVVQPVGPPPVLTEFIAFGPNPTVLEEGRSVPVRLVGQNLTADLQAEVLKEEVNNQAGGEINWNGTLDVVPGTLQLLSGAAGSSTAGITLHVRTIRDLGEGESQTYHLLLRRPDRTFTSIPFQVAGHNELELVPGQRLAWSSAGTVRFSEINIPTGAVVSNTVTRLVVDSVTQEQRLFEGVLRWESTGPIRIDGLIDGHGGNGSHGNRASGGGPGGGVGTLAGGGGNGRRGDDCFDYGLFLFDFDPRGYFVTGAYDDNDRDARSCRFLLDDAIGNSARDRTAESVFALELFRRHGFGGLPGENGSLLADIGAILSVITGAIGTALDGIACATTGTTCAVFVADIAHTAGAVADLVELFNSDAGRGLPGQPGEPSGLSGQLRGHGGGGGGGGGAYDYVFGTEPGGGGGGGGGGGKGVMLTAAGNVSLGGRIDTRGGNGGNASEDSDYITRSGQLPSPSRFSGGAGGAGSGGDVIIRSLGSTFVPTGFDPSLAAFEPVQTGGGRPGYGGIVLPRANRTPILLADPGSLPAQPGRQEFRGSPRSVSQELVLTRRFYTFSGSGFPAPATLIIRAETGAIRRVAVQPGQSSQAVLFDGFNRIYDARDEGGSDLLQRTVLVLPDGVAAGPDRDGDGLGDNDERELGTDPTRADTDGDGVNDLTELSSCRNPRVAEPPGFRTDTDCDGWPDAFEVAAGTRPTDPTSSPRFTWVSNPSLLETARPAIPAPTRIYRRGTRPTVMSRPAVLEVARPIVDPVGGAGPNTTVARPPLLEVARPVVEPAGGASLNTTVALPPFLNVERQQ